MEQLKLKPDVKAAWVAALTSGTYGQTTDRLRDDGGFCCLGVLCDIYGKQTGKGAWVDAADQDEDEFVASSEYSFLGSDTAPPKDVMRWAFENYVSPEENPEDFHASDVLVTVPGHVTINGDNVRATLAERNDTGASFETLATLINENL